MTDSGRFASSQGEWGRIRVFGLGGSLRQPSQSETALRMALRGAEDAGAVTEVFTAGNLDLPLYPGPHSSGASGAGGRERIDALLAAARRADGLIFASPAYHGTVSGTVKNAIDYLQSLADDDLPYLDGRAVGVLSTGDGVQATVQTVDTLRNIAHALRAWPTPLGVTVHEAARSLRDGKVHDEQTAALLRTLGAQVVEFVRARRALGMSGAVRERSPI